MATGNRDTEHSDNVELLELPEQQELIEEPVIEPAPVDNAQLAAEAEKARDAAEGEQQSLHRKLFSGDVPPMQPPYSKRFGYPGDIEDPPEEPPPPPADDGDDEPGGQPAAALRAHRELDGPPAPVARQTSGRLSWATPSKPAKP